MFCFPIWQQKICLGGTVLASVNDAAPIVVGSIRDFNSRVRKENPDVTIH